MLKAGLKTETGFCTVCDFAHARPIMLSILLVGRAGASPPSLTTGARRLYIYIYIVRPTVLAPGWPRATRKRSRPDRGGVRLQLLLCYIYTCSMDMPDVQSSYESRHSYEFRRESSKGTLEGASPS